MDNEHTLDRRSYKCPKCNGKLFFREGKKVICCTFGCNFIVPSKREEDKKIPESCEFNG
jgi:hypothetical protein